MTAAATPSWMSRWLGKLTLLAVSFSLSLLLGEVAVRAWTPFPIDTDSNRVSHPRLGFVLDSRRRGIDVDGFRNASVRLDDAEIVVVGDSHTYGFNVKADQSFPSLLAKKTGRSVYNMGMGSYGIYHYMVLLEDLASKPIQDVILAFYPANDLTSFGSITELPYWKEYSRAFGIETPAANERVRDADPNATDPSPKTVLSRKIALVGLIDHWRWNRLKPRGRPAVVEPSSFSLAHGQQVAISKVRSHARATSLDRERILLNYQNSLSILEAARDRFRSVGIRFGVLIVPSRERVLYEWAREAGVPDLLEDLMANQIELTGMYLDFLQREAIPHLDALPHVVSALDDHVRSGQRFYPAGRDGHPFERGYRAYADAAIELLEIARISEAEGR